jgi:hypothetical protein
MEHLYSRWRYCIGIKEWDVRVVASDAQEKSNVRKERTGCHMTGAVLIYVTVVRDRREGKGSRTKREGEGKRG